jgi:2-iminobutanoate/2-iminopropanoate deaminase
MARRTTYRHQGASSDIPLSAAVRGDGVIYASGQVPVDPQTRQVVDGGIEAQTRQTLENLKSTLALTGASLADVVKVNIFLTDMSHFSAMNGVYREYFASEPPARTTVGTTGLANPAMLIEIEAIALAPGS